MHKQKTGFTFIELLVSATIIIVLSVIGVVSFAKAGKSARDARRRTDLAMVQQAMVQYKVNEDDHEYPTSTELEDADKFDEIVTILQGADYLSDGTIEDPKNDATYKYECINCTFSAFTLRATPETDGAALIELKNP